MSRDQHQHVYLGTSSRRSACDRCRDQKLRCLRGGRHRHDGFLPCDRCVRAGSECLISTSFRMRNTFLPRPDPNPRVGAASEARPGARRPPRRARRHGSPSPGPSPGPSTSTGTSPGPVACASEPAASGDGSMGFPALAAASAAGLPFWNPYSQVAPQHPQTTASSMATSPNPFDEPHGLGRGTGTMLPFSAGHYDQAVSTGDMPPSSPRVQLPPAMQTPSSLLSPSSLPPSLPAPSHGESGLRDRHMSGSISESTQLSWHQQLEALASSPNNQEWDHGDDEMDVCIQRLSRINLSLVCQSSFVKAASNKAALSTLLLSSSGEASRAVRGAHINDIVNTVQEFLQVLIKVSHGHPHPSRRASVQSLPGRTFSTNDAGPLRPNVTFLMLAITIYIHTLRLYLFLFERIVDFLEQVSEQEDPTLTSSPGFVFNNHLIQSGNLQVTMSMQIMVNVFERLEGLLGIPGELCLGKRQVGERRGLLHVDDDIGSFAITMIRKENARLINERGGVEMLRKWIKKATRLLQESIRP